MAEHKKRADWPIIVGAILVLVVVALVAYVGGYFATSVGAYVSNELFVRDFNHDWQLKLYIPLLIVESHFRSPDEVLGACRAARTNYPP